ncbi:MBL fold metallo-hydrolase [Micromonospora sp. DT233]|uniref:MBL fold metallo-hydrolase n=1 Tax=Micromonospora sp. DT233 TaxID=3393432 RepID=UPI003CF7E3FC
MTRSDLTTCADADGAPCGTHTPPALSRRSILAAATALAGAAAVGGLPGVAAAGPRPRPRLTWYGLVPGFVEVAADEYGRPEGDGFAAANPWGAYTAYLISVSKRGHRTWRVENMQALAPRPDGSRYAQGSTMWLFEGDRRALLVDTAIDTPETAGVDDLATVVRHLLGHDDDGTVRANPVDFDVAITHRHGDHTGKVPKMTDRTVYYPDLDWQPTATPNWVPVRHDGGSTANGSTGRTVSAIDLGGRRIDVVALYGHTPGSTGYLDAENLMLATGDAIGSAYVWAHFASATTSTYAAMLRNLRRDLRPLRGLALLPAHFYQIKQFGRADPPINGRPLDLTYLDDMIRAAEGALDGSILADPYHEIGREAVWISGGSARMVYSLTNLYPGGPTGGNGDLRKFHGVRIPSRYRTDPFLDGPYAFLDNIRTDLVLIRDSADETSLLLTGTTRALLVTSGRSAPGLLRYAKRLARHPRIEVVLTDGDPASLAGIGQFAGHRLIVPDGVTVPRRLGPVTRVGDGDRIDIGRDRAGRRVRLEVYALPGRCADSVTLLDPVSRVLFAGDALGVQGTRGLTLGTSPAAFRTGLRAWRARTDGRYDTIYTAHNHQWLTRPGYVDAVQAAVDGPPVASPQPGHQAFTSGAGEFLAWVFVPQ